MNAIQNSSNTYSLYQPINWCFKKWEDLTFSSHISNHRLFRITALVIIVLIGIVGVLKARQSHQTNIEKKGETTTSLPPSKPPITRCKTYKCWDALNKRVSVTETHLQNFLMYQHEAGEETNLQAYAKNIKFFYSNCDFDLNEGSPDDLRWGCAWRSIQTCLGSFSIFYTFNSLYENYKLEPTENEWAEPGYGKRISDDYGISYDLYLYKKKLGTQKTPTKWCTQINSFEMFTDKLFQHFKNAQTPIMVDDVSYAFSILGIKKTKNEKIILWVADPHKKTLEDGLYYLVLDKNGKKIHSTGLDNDSNGLNSANRIDPNIGWMLWLPKPI